MKQTEVANCVVLYEDVFDASNFLKMLEIECENEWGYLSWVRDGVRGNEISDWRTSVSCDLTPLRKIEDASESVSQNLRVLGNDWLEILGQVDSVVWSYRESYELQLRSDEGYRVIKYGGGAEYKAHHDHGPGNSRVLSLVAFMNDGFTGGNLTFPRLDLTVEPVAGSCLLFPSNFPYQHIAEPVGENDDTKKYSLVTWFS